MSLKSIFRATALPALVTAAALPLLIGCGTVDTIAGGGIMDRPPAPDFEVYSGVSWDWHVAHHGHILPFWGWVDLPFSLILDTVLLPVSIPVTVFRSEPEPAEEVPTGTEAHHFPR